jgi:hypothetical protein
MLNSSDAMKTSEKRCIMCGLQKNGLDVSQDMVIEAIRWFKKNVTKNEKGYALVVCKECYPRYVKDRKKFERRQVMYMALGIVFALVLILASAGSILSVFYSILVFVFMYSLSLLTYIPSLNVPVSKSIVSGRSAGAR